MGAAGAATVPAAADGGPGGAARQGAAGRQGALPRRPRRGPGVVPLGLHRLARDHRVLDGATLGGDGHPGGALRAQERPHGPGCRQRGGDGRGRGRVASALRRLGGHRPCRLERHGGAPGGSQGDLRASPAARQAGHGCLRRARPRQGAQAADALHRAGGQGLWAQARRSCQGDGPRRLPGDEAAQLRGRAEGPARCARALPRGDARGPPGHRRRDAGARAGRACGPAVRDRPQALRGRHRPPSQDARRERPEARDDVEQPRLPVRRARGFRLQAASAGAVGGDSAGHRRSRKPLARDRALQLRRLPLAARRARPRQ